MGLLLTKSTIPMSMRWSKKLNINRMILQDDQPGVDDNLQLYLLSYGRSLGRAMVWEIYLERKQSPNQESFEIQSYEVGSKMATDGTGTVLG